MSTKPQTKAKSPFALTPSFTPLWTGSVQRDCEWGENANSTGKFAGSRDKRLMSQPHLIQPKLIMGQPRDKYEKEADRLADEVERIQEPQALQQAEDEGRILQDKHVSNRLLEVTSKLESSVHTLKGGGQPLPESERSFFKPLFGYDFSRVRIHTNSKAAGITRALNARAATTGQDIIFAPGQYSLGSEASRSLLAHELTHVVQQRSRKGRSSGVSRTGDTFEQEAEAATHAALRGEQITVRPSSQVPLIQKKDGVEYIEFKEEEVEVITAKQPGRTPETPSTEGPMVVPCVKLPIPEAPVTAPPISAGLFTVTASLKLSGDITVTRTSPMPAAVASANARSLSLEITQNFATELGGMGYEITSEGLAITVFDQRFPMEMKITGNSIEFKAAAQDIRKVLGDWEYKGSLGLVLTLTLSGNWVAIRAFLLALSAAAALAVLAARIGAWLAAAFGLLARGLVFVYSRMILPIIIIPPELLEKGPPGTVPRGPTTA
jgi:hypothetical protein